MKYLLTIILSLSIISCKSEGNSDIDSSKFDKTIDKITKAELPSEEFEKYSYALGHRYIREASKDSLFKLNPLYFILGAIEAMDESEDYLSESQIKRLEMEFQQYMQNQDQKNKEKEMELFKKQGEIFKSMHDDYIAQFKKQFPDYKTTKSGVLYKLLRPGLGPFAKEQDFITFKSNGYYMDGNTFDNSLSQNQTKQFMLKDFFPGMREIMEMLNEGARIVAVIPYDQAFGDQGNPPNFPPYSTLKMEIEVVKIDKLPEGSEGLQGLPEGVKIKDIRSKRVDGPPKR